MSDTDKFIRGLSDYYSGNDSRENQRLRELLRRCLPQLEKLLRFEPNSWDLITIIEELRKWD